MVAQIASKCPKLRPWCLSLRGIDVVYGVYEAIIPPVPSVFITAPSRFVIYHVEVLTVAGISLPNPHFGPTVPSPRSSQSGQIVPEVAINGHKNYPADIIRLIERCPEGRSFYLEHFVRHARLSPKPRRWLQCQKLSRSSRLLLTILPPVTMIVTHFINCEATRSHYRSPYNFDFDSHSAFDGHRIVHPDDVWYFYCLPDRARLWNEHSTSDQFHHKYGHRGNYWLCCCHIYSVFYG
jgi:hypothetical protein